MVRPWLRALVAAAAGPERLCDLPLGILAHVENKKYDLGFIALNGVSSDKTDGPGVGRGNILNITVDERLGSFVLSYLL